jgi:hypothetical protein
MIKEHILEDGTKRFQVYVCARVRDKRTRVYVGTFATRRDARPYKPTPNVASRSA